MNISNIEIVKQSQLEEKTFSLLIPSWNNLPYLKLCIRSIRQNSEFRHQIIIVANEGKDGTLEWLQSQTDIDYVYSKDNLGICYGLNACRPLIETSHIVYINDDMYLLPGWDTAFRKVVQNLGHNKFMLSGTMIEPKDTHNPCVTVADYGDSLESFREKELLASFRNLNKPDWSGSTWPPVLIPTLLWDIVGGMSPEFSPGMYSDPDLSMKLWQVGVRFFKGVGQSKVYHFGSKSTKRVKKNKGKDMFLQKYGMTSRSFTQNYLKRGKDFTGPLSNPEICFTEKLLNKIKLFLNLFS